MEGDVEEDVERVASVRKAIGPRVSLMCDASRGFTVLPDSQTNPASGHISTFVVSALDRTYTDYLPSLNLAADDADPAWVPDIVHAHDWHAAMACAYIADHPATQAASVYTVHNLAFQGLFPHHDWALLGMSSRFMSPAGLEYHGQLSFMKAGLKFADKVTTVSPSYAREIATHEFGCGLDGVIRSRGADVSGIVNGIDEAVWNPATGRVARQVLLE